MVLFLFLYLHMCLFFCFFYFSLYKESEKFKYVYVRFWTLIKYILKKELASAGLDLRSSRVPRINAKIVKTRTVLPGSKPDPVCPLNAWNRTHGEPRHVWPKSVEEMQTQPAPISQWMNRLTWNLTVTDDKTQSHLHFFHVWQNKDRTWTRYNNLDSDNNCLYVSIASFQSSGVSRVGDLCSLTLWPSTATGSSSQVLLRLGKNK